LAPARTPWRRPRGRRERAHRPAQRLIALAFVVKAAPQCALNKRIQWPSSDGKVGLSGPIRQVDAHPTATLMLQKCQLDLWSASEHGNAQEVRRCLDAGAKAAITNRLGWNAVHRASINGSADVIEMLLQGDDDKARLELLARPDGAGNTALHIAAGSGHVGAVEVLLRAGASAAASGKGKQDGSDDPGTPLHLTCRALSMAKDEETQQQLREVVRRRRAPMSPPFAA
jgi:ankyrin repeat protein